MVKVSQFGLVLGIVCALSGSILMGANAAPDRTLKESLQDLTKHVKQTCGQYWNEALIQVTQPRQETVEYRQLEELKKLYPNTWPTKLLARLQLPSQTSSTAEQQEPAIEKQVHEKEQSDEFSCVICFEALAKEAQQRLPCMHGFHSQCLKTWFAKKKSLGQELICPICKHSASDNRIPVAPVIPVARRHADHNGNPVTPAVARKRAVIPVNPRRRPGQPLPVAPPVALPAVPEHEYRQYPLAVYPLPAALPILPVHAVAAPAAAVAAPAPAPMPIPPVAGPVVVVPAVVPGPNYKLMFILPVVYAACKHFGFNKTALVCRIAHVLNATHPITNITTSPFKTVLRGWLSDALCVVMDPHYKKEVEGEAHAQFWGRMIGVTGISVGLKRWIFG